MIGVILAAGMAKRLRPLTDTQPKCLLTVGGRTLLERTVEAMRQAGISEFVVVTVARIAQEPESALAVNCHKCGEEEIKVIVDAELHITEINKTCRPEDALGESVGIEKMTAAYSQALYRELDQMILREDLIDVFYERAFERLIPQGHTFRVVDTTHYYSYEIDTPEDYEHVRNQTILP